MVPIPHRICSHRKHFNAFSANSPLSNNKKRRGISASLLEWSVMARRHTTELLRILSFKSDLLAQRIIQLARRNVNPEVQLIAGEVH